MTAQNESAVMFKKSSMSNIDSSPRVHQQNVEEEESPQNETTNSKGVNAPEAQHLIGLQLWVVVIAVTLVAFVMLLDMSIIVTEKAIPRITSDFHSLDDVGWYGSAYLLASCALQPLTGKMYSMFTLKYTFLSFLGIFELGSTLCGAAKSSRMLIVGRAVAGLGGSGLTNGAFAILAVAAPQHRQPGVMMGGIWIIIVSQLAIVCGPLIGGALTQHASWRWCFYINLPIGAVVAVVLLTVKFPDRLPSIDKSKPTARTILRKLDLVGFVIFAAFAVMISFALEWGGTMYSWRSSVIIGLFCGGVLALILFIAWERHVGNMVAMIPPAVATRREVWCSCLFLGFFSGSMLVFSYYLPIYFQAVKNVSPTLSGVYMLPGILAQIMMAILSGMAIEKMGYYSPWALASGVMVSVAAGLVSTFQPNTPVVEWVVYQFIGGFGRGCGTQTPVIAIQNSLPPEQRALGVSLAIFGQTFGGSIFLSLAQVVFSNGLDAGLHIYAPTVNQQTLTTAGATAFRQAVSQQSLAGVLRAYCLGIDRTFYLSVGASTLTFLCAFGMGWRKIGKKRGEGKTEKEGGQQ